MNWIFLPQPLIMLESQYVPPCLAILYISEGWQAPGARHRHRHRHGEDLGFWAGFLSTAHVLKDEGEG